MVRLATRRHVVVVIVRLRSFMSPNHRVTRHSYLANHVVLKYEALRFFVGFSLARISRFLTSNIKFGQSMNSSSIIFYQRDTGPMKDILLKIVLWRMYTFKS